MISKKMSKILTIIIFLNFYLISALKANQADFNIWKKKFEERAIDSGVSVMVVNDVMSKAIFLPKVIEYDRYQPEFYEDTKTYISKRTSKRKVSSGLNYYKNNKEIINNVDLNFGIEKELLLALMGIETNFGLYLGKMDIVSSLATLSYDKRRSQFFTDELLILLR